MVHSSSSEITSSYTIQQPVQHQISEQKTKPAISEDSETKQEINHIRDNSLTALEKSTSSKEINQPAKDYSTPTSRKVDELVQKKLSLEAANKKLSETKTGNVDHINRMITTNEKKIALLEKQISEISPKNMHDFIQEKNNRELVNKKLSEIKTKTPATEKLIRANEKEIKKLEGQIATIKNNIIIEDAKWMRSEAFKTHDELVASKKLTVNDLKNELRELNGQLIATVKRDEINKLQQMKTKLDSENHSLAGSRDSNVKNKIKDNEKKIAELTKQAEEFTDDKAIEIIKNLREEKKNPQKSQTATPSSSEIPIFSQYNTPKIPTPSEAEINSSYNNTEIPTSDKDDIDSSYNTSETPPPSEAGINSSYNTTETPTSDKGEIDSLYNTPTIPTPTTSAAEINSSYNTTEIPTPDKVEATSELVNASIGEIFDVHGSEIQGNVNFETTEETINELEEQIADMKAEISTAKEQVKNAMNFKFQTSYSTHEGSYIQSPDAKFVTGDTRWAGGFKEVRPGVMLDPTKNTRTNVVVGRQLANSLNVRDHVSGVTEYEVNALLANDPLASNFAPKVITAAISEGKLMTVTKLANGGSAEKVIDEYSNRRKMQLLGNAAEAIQYLHDKGINHNDISGRNLLIHYPQKWVRNKDAVGHHASQPIFDNKGKILIPSGKKIEKTDLIILQRKGISQITIRSGARPKALITDFGCCTFKDRENKAIPRPIKETAPEKEISDASDAFMFGMMILEFHLPPGERGEMKVGPGREKALQKKAAEKKAYEAYLKDPANNPSSAIDQHEYDELKKIHPRLADLTRDLMSFDPTKRPIMKECQKILKEIENDMKNIPEHNQKPVKKTAQQSETKKEGNVAATTQAPKGSKENLAQKDIESTYFNTEVPQTPSIKAESVYFP
jgi:hypothetical protein